MEREKRIPGRRKKREQKEKKEPKQTQLHVGGWLTHINKGGRVGVEGGGGGGEGRKEGPLSCLLCCVFLL
jgi:hypothetical protein